MINIDDEPTIEHKPADVEKSQIDQENMRQQEFEKHTVAIKSRIKQLEEQIRQEETQVDQIKQRSNALAQE